MGAKIDNKANPEANRYWNADGTYDPTGKGNLNSSADPWGNLNAAAGGTPPPPDSPDITDQLIRQKRASEMTRLMLGVGRRSTFSQGGMGDLQLGQTSLVAGGK